jgi:hypothetical protein
MKPRIAAALCALGLFTSTAGASAYDPNAPQKALWIPVDGCVLPVLPQARP